MEHKIAKCVAGGSFAATLLAWYDRNARKLPWRVPPKAIKASVKPDPYQVWLSEIMLQQTQAITVAPYYDRFVGRWPDVSALAMADDDDIMRAWAGLGYYSRARNLKKCAETVMREYDCRFPQTAKALKQLPGIGDYTSAAIAAIAFDQAVAVVDGNVERIIARLERISVPVKKAKKQISALVAGTVPKDRPGEFAQAMMDLGATVCKPKAPNCSLCPVRSYCAAHGVGEAEHYPAKPDRTAKPRRSGAAFVIENNAGYVLLTKRPDNGLLGGMAQVPTTEWTARRDGATGRSALPFTGDWRMAGKARHAFTHFHLDLEVWHTRDGDGSLPDGRWVAQKALSGEALPTVMKKAIAVALPGVFDAND